MITGKRDPIWRNDCEKTERTIQQRPFSYKASADFRRYVPASASDYSDHLLPAEYPQYDGQSRWTDAYELKTDCGAGESEPGGLYQCSVPDLSGWRDYGKHQGSAGGLGYRICGGL